MFIMSFPQFFKNSLTQFHSNDMLILCLSVAVNTLLVESMRAHEELTLRTGFNAITVHQCCHVFCHNFVKYTNIPNFLKYIQMF